MSTQRQPKQADVVSINTALVLKIFAVKYIAVVVFATISVLV